MSVKVKEEKKVSLNIFQRMHLTEALPENTGWTDWQVKKAIMEKMDISEDERKQFGIGVGTKLDAEMIDLLSKSTSKEIPFTDFQHQMISKKLRELEKDNKLTNKTGPLYEKFCI